MFVSKKLAADFKIKRHNETKMKTILDISKKFIEKQNSGCFSHELGVLYINRVNQNRDSIGCLLPAPLLNGHFGLISDDAQKPLVNAIIQKFQVDVCKYSERVKFINFLQDLQDAHDLVFDEFDHSLSGEVPEFSGNCNQIAFAYKLISV